MFSLTIVFGPGPMVWTLMFQDQAKAALAAIEIDNTSSENRIHLGDDFGQVVSISRAEIHGSMLEDMEQSRLAHIERALHQARTQAKGAEIADADPVLRQARMKAHGQSMPILQPMGNGRFPG